MNCVEVMKLATALTLGLVASSHLMAQRPAPTDGGFTVSLGQPRTWKATAGAATGWLIRGDDAQAVTEARLGIFHDLLNPIVGIAGFHLETYAGFRDLALDGGVRARVVSPFARLGFGVDYNAVEGRAHLLLSIFNSGRRGGLFRDGSIVRLDLVPGRDHYVSIGIDKPVLRRIPMGRTRPVLDYVPLPTAGPRRVTPGAQATAPSPYLARAREAATWIRRLSIPFLDFDASSRRGAQEKVMAELRELQRAFRTPLADSGGGARTLEGEVRRYHAEIARAFSVASATGGLPPDTTTDVGRTIAAQTRRILLSEVLLPYDRLLGQRKEKDSIYGFGDRARGSFVRWLHVESPVPPEARAAVVGVFASLLDVLESNRVAARQQWGDSRFVWLPLQYALLPEDHDTQAELDGLIEQAAGESFTEGNFVSYVINEQFQYQLSRTIRQAKDYHVLWTHDFRGIDRNGAPDEMSFRHVLRSYFAALTEHVRAYDRTGHFPVYLILLDEWFYEVNQSRRWMNLLENPTEYRMHLPDGYSAWEDSIAAAQQALRTAIAESPLLQAQRAQYGDRWLRNLVKVHVNITNPSDPSFWSWGVAPFISLPDNVMRDHRKVVFYDLTEEDPYRGEALYTGAGVGEHYANLSWEDRALLVRGPAVLALKSAAREALLNQGIALPDIPSPLQARPRGPDYDAVVRSAVRENQRPLRALQLNNATGFGSKQVNVAKALLYTLMPPGSVIKIPDSLWNSAFWGSALVGCALRGVRVLIIAPSFASAPARAFGSIERSHELLWRLLAASHAFGPEIAAAGGLLKVGLYSSQIAVTDIPGKVASVRQALTTQAWLRELFAFSPSVYDGLTDLAEQLNGLSMAPVGTPEFEYDPRPLLHMKANFFASREAWRLMSRPEWIAMTWEFAQQRIAQVQTRTAAVRSFAEYPDATLDVGGGMVEDWYANLDAATRARVVFYTLMGSHNQNYRSMVVDGEVTFVVSNWPSVIPYLDFLSVIGQTRWLDDATELDRLLPPSSERKRRLARKFKLAF